MLKKLSHKMTVLLLGLLIFLIVKARFEIAEAGQSVLFFEVFLTNESNSVDVTVTPVGMLFNDILDYSLETSTNHNKPGLAITGGTVTVPANQPKWGIVNHVFTSTPSDPLAKHIGFGKYKVQIDVWGYIYVDFSDSDYSAAYGGTNEPNSDIFLRLSSDNKLYWRSGITGTEFQLSSGDVIEIWDQSRVGDPTKNQNKDGFKILSNTNIPLQVSGHIDPEKLFVNTDILGDVTVNQNWIVDGGAAKFEVPGTIVEFTGSFGMNIRNGGQIIAGGTAPLPVTFTSGPFNSTWGTMYIYTSNNQLKYCTVEDGNWGVKIEGNPSATTGNVVDNCTFRNNDQGLRIHNSTVTVNNCTLKDNRHAFVILSNATVTLQNTLVEHNDRDGIYCSGSVVDVFGARFEYNGEGNVSSIHGIYAFSSADISLGSRIYYSDPNTAAGLNTIRNNHGAGIRVSSSATVTAGDVSVFQYYRAGNNSLHDNGTLSGTYSGYDFYNQSSFQYAENNYWGGSCPPASSQVFGSVSTSSCQSSSPTGYALDITGLGDLRPLDVSGNAVSKNNASLSQDPDTQIKLSIIAQNQQLIAAQPNSRAAVDALQQLYSFVRTDTSNKLGQKSSIYGYLNGLYASYAKI